MVLGYKINDQKEFVVYLIPSLDWQHYPIVKLKKTLISYSPLRVSFYDDMEQCTRTNQE